MVSEGPLHYRSAFFVCLVVYLFFKEFIVCFMYKYKQNIFICDFRIDMDFFSFGIKPLKKKISVPILDGRNKLILVY